MLAETHARLHEHFLSLSLQRTVLGYPVYALEHGLASSEIELLRTTLARELSRQRILSPAHWLLWVVIATEIGYTYDGDEYWNSFAEAIPDWQRYGVRATIRAWFVDFARRYRGFHPTGRWSQHFSIIAWPIAHAILPRDLQGQFARHLYGLRYALTSQPEFSIGKLGSILQAGDPGGSSRFQHFLDQTELTARLVLALRDEDVQDAVPAIQRQTLARLVTDLEGRQSARDWLREARKILREARMRESGALGYRGGGGTEAGAPQSESSCGVRLVARQSSEGAWLVGIKIPDVGKIIQQAGLAPKVLDQTRVRLADRPDHWMPGRALLSLGHGEQRIGSLQDLIGAPVLRFERDVKGLSALLSEALCIIGSSPWLLRLQDDGVARQVLGNHVRANQSYLIVSDTPLEPASVCDLKLRVIDFGTPGAVGYFLSVPSVLSATELQALAAIKLGYALRANIEPMGLVPRWDGAAGCTVWLTTEEPVLRLSADHRVREFTVTIDRSPVVRIPVSNPPEAIVSLGYLSPGLHVIEVGGTAAETHGRRLEPERFELTIRAPVPWVQGIRDQAGFRAILEPADASLESVVAGKARVAVIGPRERSVTIDARFFNLNGHVTESFGLGTVASLTDEAGIRRLLVKLAKEPLAEKVQTAPRVDLIFLVDELGVDSLSFPLKVRPLRWRLTAGDHDYRVRLIDEAGNDQRVIISLYEIAQPDRKLDADYAPYLDGQAIGPPGALLTAVCDNRRYSAIASVPPHQRLTTLNDLGVTITVSPTLNEAQHIPRLLALLRLWNHAQQSLGPLSLLRKAEVSVAFEQRIAAILCGTGWADRARACRSAADPSLEQLRRDIGGSPGFGARLRANDWRSGADDPAVCAEFIRLAAVYQVSDNPALCTLALRLAFAPLAIKFSTRDEGISNWVGLAQIPTLARGAFFARLATNLSAQKVRATEVA
jgi:hypothetical protein